MVPNSRRKSSAKTGQIAHILDATSIEDTQFIRDVPDRQPNASAMTEISRMIGLAPGSGCALSWPFNNGAHVDNVW